MQGVLEKGRRANPQQCTFLDPCREMASWAELGRAGMDGPLDISQPMYPSQVAWSLQMLDFATPAQAFEGVRGPSCMCWQEMIRRGHSGPSKAMRGNK